jgi:hypothetical protein
LNPPARLVGMTDACSSQLIRSDEAGREGYSRQTDDRARDAANAEIAQAWGHAA